MEAVDRFVLQNFVDVESTCGIWPALVHILAVLLTDGMRLTVRT